jgi:hypothetical protein
MCFNPFVMRFLSTINIDKHFSSLFFELILYANNSSPGKKQKRNKAQRNGVSTFSFRRFKTFCPTEEHTSKTMIPTGKTNCQLAECRRAASAYCYCCKRNVCTHHFLEHIERMKAKIDPLANEVNNTMESIQHLTVEQLSRPIFAELNEWQKNMHEMIDEIHAKKAQEIDEIMKVNKSRFDEHRRTQLETMIKLQGDVKQVAEDGDVTFEQIESFQNQLRQIEASLAAFEKNFLSMNTRVLPDGLVIVASKLNDPTPPVNRARPRRQAVPG